MCHLYKIIIYIILKYSYQSQIMNVKYHTLNMIEIFSNISSSWL